MANLLFFLFLLPGGGGWGMWHVLWLFLSLFQSAFSILIGVGHPKDHLHCNPKKCKSFTFSGLRLE